MRRLGLALACCTTLAAACESSLSLEQLLEGRPCRRGERPCLDGYRCDDNDVCVRGASGQGGESGSGGAGGSAGGGGAGEAGGSGDGGGGVMQGSGGMAAGGGEQGGAAGDAGAGGSVSQGGSDVVDASVPPGDGGCVPGPLYRDRDGDGYGSEAPGDVELGCELEGFVSVGGDCHDVEPTFFDQAQLVNPGQTGFFEFSYVDASKPGGISFDFDCSGDEEADPTNDPPGAQPNCPNLLGGLACGGSGFRNEGRSGPGILGQCGSEFIVTCVTQAVTQCVPLEQLTPSRAFACR